jgi:hypothetical protein
MNNAFLAAVGRRIGEHSEYGGPQHDEIPVTV